ncbi:MAG: AAA family ATPase [Microgenomates group bacterium]
MTLRTISLQDFRAYSQKKIDFEKNITVLVGPNAIGKTTIIEAIHLLATGDSFRAFKTDEMIKFGSEFARVTGKTDSDTIEILLTNGLVQGKRVAPRIFSLNSVKKQKRSVVGAIQSVVFRPEDMRLIEGSPPRRRAFLDSPLKLLFPEYDRSLSTFDKALRRRNKLLQEVREGGMSKTTLHYWDQTLLKHGTLIQKYRQRLVEFFTQVDFPVSFRGHYLPSILSESRQEQYRAKEIAAGRSLIGPQKDDVSVELVIGGEFRDVGVFGSRGQQRLAVLWLKMCELAFLAKQSDQTPLLLLDDILSELDREKREMVLSLTDTYQTILTTATKSIVDEVQSSVTARDATIILL